LTWEFPPRNVGQVSRDMEALAKALVTGGYTVDVITFHESITGTERRKEGFLVHRVGNTIRTHVNIVTWAMILNTEFERVATDIILTSEGEQVVHSSEWLCVPAAVQLKRTLSVPFVLSLHSLESDRSSGGPLSGAITYLEKLGCTEASQLLLRDGNMVEKVKGMYAPPENALIVVPSFRLGAEKLVKRYEIATASPSTHGSRVEPR